MRADPHPAEHPQSNSHPRLFPVITGLFVMSLLVANVTAAKLIELGPLVLPGGIILFPLSFIFGDILTEVYGYSRSRQIIWTGFVCMVLAAAAYWVVGALPAASFWTDQAAYDRILGFVPRVVAGSIFAFFVGEFCNSWVLSKLKFRAQGATGWKQAWRFVGSTLAGEAADTLIALLIMFGGVLTTSQLLQTGISVYLVKVCYEIIALPISIPVSNWLKRVEATDRIDRPENTNYNPFAFRTSRPA